MTKAKGENYFWEGGQIRLRPFQASDYDLIYKEQVDSEGVRVLQCGIELPRSQEMDKTFADQFVNFKDVNRAIMFSIETLKGDLVGGINIHSKDPKNGTFSFGIRIARKYRKKGYASDALRIALRYCFNELRYQKANSDCFNTNAASIALHKKVGFVEEGIRRRHTYTDGRYYDHVLFGLTKEDFNNNDKKIKTEHKQSRTSKRKHS